MISRRSLITGLVSLVAAPAIVRVSSIMPVKSEKPELIVQFRTINNPGAGYTSAPTISMRTMRDMFMPGLRAERYERWPQIDWSVDV